jgi:hypothetical protein
MVRCIAQVLFNHVHIDIALLCTTQAAHSLRNANSWMIDLRTRQNPRAAGAASLLPNPGKMAWRNSYTIPELRQTPGYRNSAKTNERME